MEPKLVTLAQVKPGSCVTIAKITVKGLIKQRLMEMGIVVGDSVTVTKVAPLGDPIEITVKNYQLSLRNQEAEQIVVTV
jgi:ferrous iron transport protein A